MKSQATLRNGEARELIRLDQNIHDRVAGDREAGFLPFVELPISIEGGPIRLIETYRVRLAAPGMQRAIEYTIDHIDPLSRRLELTAISAGASVRREVLSEPGTGRS